MRWAACLVNQRETLGASASAANERPAGVVPVGNLPMQQ